MTLATLPLPTFTGADLSARLNAALTETRAARRFRSVADLLADASMTYGTGPRTVAPGDRIETASGFSYDVVAADAAPGAFDRATAGGVKLVVHPAPDGTISLQAFGSPGDGSDERVVLLAALAAAARTATTTLTGTGGATVVSRVGAVHGFSGRLRLPTGVTLDLGRGGSAAKLLALDPTGGLEMEAGSRLIGELRASHPAFTGPLLEVNAQKSAAVFGRNDKATFFDAGLRGNRQAGSVGLLMTADAGLGVAWVEGRAEVGEMDFGVQMIANGTGYVNECWLNLKVYDATEALQMLVNGTGEVAANRIELTAQTGSGTGAAARAGINIRCDGQRNFIRYNGWDWQQAKLKAGYDGTQILLTDKSGSNQVTGFGSRSLAAGFGRPVVIDNAPAIRRNFATVDSQRQPDPQWRSVLPSAYLDRRMVGDQDDELAWAADGRWTVTAGGAQPATAANLSNLFRPDGSTLQVAACTQSIVTVDFGATQAGTDFNAMGIIFHAAANTPQRVMVEASTDNATWTTQLTAGYDGGAVPPVLHRIDGSGFSSFRYLRLTCESDAPITLRIARWFLASHGSARSGGAWARRFTPTFYGTANLVAAPSVAIPRLQIAGTNVVGPRATGWAADTGTARRAANASYSATASAAYTQAEVQTLMNAVRDLSQTVKALKDDLIAHGLIGA